MEKHVTAEIRQTINAFQADYQAFSSEKEKERVNLQKVHRDVMSKNKGTQVNLSITDCNVCVVQVPRLSEMHPCV